MSAPQLYLRRCDGQPTAGVPTSRAAVQLASRPGPGTAVSGDLDTGLAVRIAAGRPCDVEAPGTRARVFTYTPVRQP